jgi:hypothetical protein
MHTRIDTHIIAQTHVCCFSVLVHDWSYPTDVSFLPTLFAFSSPYTLQATAIEIVAPIFKSIVETLENHLLKVR